MDRLGFEIKHRDGLGRIGEIIAGGKRYETPLLMPVVNPNIKLIEPRELMDTFGFRALITNSYIIYRRQELRERALDEGLHRMLGFDGLIMTDSGTFQSHVYGEVPVSNSEIVSFEMGIGTDIGTILDIFTEPDYGRDEVREAIDETTRRLREAVEIRGESPMAIAAPIQGGTHPDLRRYAASSLSGEVCEYHPIGGVVPLMEQYRYRELAEVVLSVQSAVNPARPLHLFGGGHPMIFPLAVALGIDAFDSASYAKYAKDGRMLTPTGTVHLKDLEYLECSCPVCSRYGDPGSLMELPPREKALELARHNLWVTRAELDRTKQALREGTLMELLEERAHAHPALMEALHWLRENLGSTYRPLYGRYASISTRLLYRGDFIHSRPDVDMFVTSLRDRYTPYSKRAVVLDFKGRPYGPYYREIMEAMGDYDAVFVVNDPILGAVPLELEGMYPVSQMVHPREDYLPEGVRRRAASLFDDFMKSHGLEVIDMDDAAGDNGLSCDELFVRAAVDLAWGSGAFDGAFKGDIEVIKSRKTGRIRNVLLNGEHVLSIDSSTYWPVPKLKGARLLYESGPFIPWVEVNEDSAEFNRQGRNVFSAFVTAAGEFRPMEYVAVVHGDEVIAVGKGLLSSSEIPYFQRGVAIKVKEGAGKE